MTIETSVIVPCYGQARFLAEAIASALAQTRSPGEILVVDDGSPDETAEVARSFGAPVVLLRHATNLGLSAARNTAMVRARGRYLAFLDADDRWDARFLERSLGALERRAASAGTYSRFRLIDAEGRPIGERGEVVSERRFPRWIEDWNVPIVSSWILRSESAAAVGLFDPDLGALEDRDYLLRLAWHHTLSGVDESLLSVRRHAANMTAAVERLHVHRLRLLAKHFGPPPDDGETAPRDRRRAYGLAHASAGVEFIVAGREEEAWALLRQAVGWWPAAAVSDRTLWELLCGDLAPALRLRPPADALDRRRPSLIRRLAELAEGVDSGARRTIPGRAHLNLAWMYYGAGRRGAAARDLASALGEDPLLAFDARAAGLGARLALGPSAGRLARALRRHLRRLGSAPAQPRRLGITGGGDGKHPSRS